VNNPTDYPESDTQPRITLTKPLRQVAGILGMAMLFEMYNEPYAPFLPHLYPYYFRVHMSLYIEQLAQCIGAGLVTMAATGNGFTLTVDGRFYVARELNMTKRYILSDDYERKDGRSRDDMEWWSRVQDTY
jgi:hypothetical protein